MHVKTPQAQEWRLLLVQRGLIVNKLIDVEAEIRGTLHGFGLIIGREVRSSRIGAPVGTGARGRRSRSCARRLGMPGHT